MYEKARRFPFATQREKGMSPENRALPFMLQDRAGFARPGITTTAKRAQTPRVLSCPRRGIAPRRRMIDITVRFDPIDNACTTMISLSV